MEEVKFSSLEFNLYELLNLPINCTTDEVKKTFRRLIKKFHPDKITDVEEKLYYNITLANHILSNPNTKEKYDVWLLNSHKSHSSLRDNFKEDLVNIKQYFPQTKEEAQDDFKEKFDMLGKRHGDFVQDSRNLQQIYNIKEKERSKIKVEKEAFNSMDEFNNAFTQRKKNGIYCDKIVKRNTDIQPFTFGNSSYAEIKDFNNVYKKDTQLSYAFELMPADEDNIPNKTTSQIMDEYNKTSQALKQSHTNRNFNDLDF